MHWEKRVHHHATHAAQRAHGEERFAPLGGLVYGDLQGDLQSETEMSPTLAEADSISRSMKPVDHHQGVRSWDGSCPFQGVGGALGCITTTSTKKSKAVLSLLPGRPRVAALWTLLASFFNKSGTAYCKAVSWWRMAAWKYSFTELYPAWRIDAPTLRKASADTGQGGTPVTHVPTQDSMRFLAVWASMFAWTSSRAASRFFCILKAGPLLWTPEWQVCPAGRRGPHS